MSIRTPRVAVAAALVMGLLAGCAGQPAYNPETAERLQERVLAVSASTAESDWATASTRLLELEASASEALARGEITQERFEAIMSAVSLVRTDVDAAIAAAEAAAAAEAQRQAEADRAAAAEAARQAEEAARAAEEDRGRGKDDDDDKGGKKDDD